MMKAAIVISARDNVATALTALDAGLVVSVDGHEVTPRQRIPSGHKMALRDIGAGEPVIKYGQPIGLATAVIHAGDHVHTHNLSSTRGRGDLAGEPMPGGETR
jgi:altronate dehydratase